MYIFWLSISGVSLLLAVMQAPWVGLALCAYLTYQLADIAYKTKERKRNAKTADNRGS